MRRGAYFLRTIIRVAFGRRLLTVRGEGGTPLRFSPREYPSLILGIARFEPEIRARWERLIEEGETIFDVGANIGVTVQRFAALTNGLCAIHAFEPVPRNVELLRRNVATFDDRVHVVQVAVGDSNGRVVIDDNERHGALSRLRVTSAVQGVEHAFWQQFSPIEVDMVTLDQYCTAHPEAAPSFVKIDVEGAGGGVLRGAAETLRRHLPTVSVSFHGEQEKREVLDALSSHGYRGVRFDSDRRLSWCDLGSCPGDFVHPDSQRALRVAGAPSGFQVRTAAI